MLTNQICKTLMAGMLIATTATGFAATPENAKAKKERKLKVDEQGNPLVCKQMVMTGSRLPREACATAEEWKRLNDEAW